MDTRQTFTSSCYNSYSLDSDCKSKPLCTVALCELLKDVVTIVEPEYEILYKYIIQALQHSVMLYVIPNIRETKLNCFTPHK